MEVICRVCRCEGTDDNPLRQPCLCSGSIQYVHEQCLLEWLQRSNKSKCELCGHVFKFKNVYSVPDDQIKEVPVHKMLVLVVARLVGNLMSTIAYGCRSAFVVIVWGVIVPLCASSILHFCFKLNDGGASFESGGSITGAFSRILSAFSEFYNYSSSRRLLSSILSDTFTKLDGYSLLNRIIEGLLIGICLAGICLMVMLLHDQFNQMVFLRQIDQTRFEWFTRDQFELMIIKLNEKLGLNVIVGQNLQQELLEQLTDQSDASLNIERDFTHSIGQASSSSVSSNQLEDRLNDSAYKFNNQELDGVDTNSQDQQQWPFEQDRDHGQPDVVRLDEFVQFYNDQAPWQDADADVPVEEGQAAVMPMNEVEELPRIPDLEPEDHQPAVDQEPAFQNAGRQNIGVNNDLDDVDIGDLGLLDLLGFRGPIAGLLINATYLVLFMFIFITAFLKIPYSVGVLSKQFLSMFGSVNLFSPVQMVAAIEANFVRNNNSTLSELGELSTKNGNQSVQDLQILSPAVIDFAVNILPTIGLGYLTMMAACVALLMLSTEHIKILLVPLRLLDDSRQLEGDVMSYILSIQRRVKRILNFSLLSIKIVIILLLELVIFPLACGVFVHICAMPLLYGADQNGKFLKGLVENGNFLIMLIAPVLTCVYHGFLTFSEFHQSHQKSSLFLHWFAGTMYMFSFAYFTSYLRKCFRPGLLWFIKDPSTSNNDFNPITEILEKPFGRQMQRIFLSLWMYFLIIFSVFGIPSFSLLLIEHWVNVVQFLWTYVSTLQPSDMAACLEKALKAASLTQPSIIPLRLDLRFGLPVVSVYEFFCIHMLFPFAIKRSNLINAFTMAWRQCLFYLASSLKLRSFLYGGIWPEDDISLDSSRMESHSTSNAQNPHEISINKDEKICLQNVRSYKMDELDYHGLVRVIAQDDLSSLAEVKKAFGQDLQFPPEVRSISFITSTEHGGVDITEHPMRRSLLRSIVSPFSHWRDPFMIPASSAESNLTENRQYTLDLYQSVMDPRFVYFTHKLLMNRYLNVPGINTTMFGIIPKTNTQELLTAIVFKPRKFRIRMHMFAFGVWALMVCVQALFFYIPILMGRQMALKVHDCLTSIGAYYNIVENISTSTENPPMLHDWYAFTIGFILLLLVLKFVQRAVQFMRDYFYMPWKALEVLSHAVDQRIIQKVRTLYGVDVLDEEVNDMKADITRQFESNYTLVTAIQEYFKIGALLSTKVIDLLLLIKFRQLQNNVSGEEIRLVSANSSRLSLSLLDKIRLSWIMLYNQYLSSAFWLSMRQFVSQGIVMMKAAYLIGWYCILSFLDAMLVVLVVIRPILDIVYLALSLQNAGSDPRKLSPQFVNATSQPETRFSAGFVYRYEIFPIFDALSIGFIFTSTVILFIGQLNLGNVQRLARIPPAPLMPLPRDDDNARTSPYFVRCQRLAVRLYSVLLFKIQLIIHQLWNGKLRDVSIKDVHLICSLYILSAVALIALPFTNLVFVRFIVSKIRFMLPSAIIELYLHNSELQPLIEIAASTMIYPLIQLVVLFYFASDILSQSLDGVIDKAYDDAFLVGKQLQDLSESERRQMARTSTLSSSSTSAVSNGSDDDGILQQIPQAVGNQLDAAPQQQQQD
ncbi:hypothetical protein MIR68_000758 [Amoeboaphelidium protococcarum]|nr:hypothetical protein MIR68_000758 [Amoeboaphelidium protococcarum]